MEPDRFRDCHQPAPSRPEHLSVTSCKSRVRETQVTTRFGSQRLTVSSEGCNSAHPMVGQNLWITTRTAQEELSFRIATIFRGVVGCQTLMHGTVSYSVE